MLNALFKVLWYTVVVVVELFSHVRLFATPWTVAHQAPLSMGFLWQEYSSGLPFPSPGDLPETGIEPTSPAFAGGFFTTDPLYISGDRGESGGDLPQTRGKEL